MRTGHLFLIGSEKVYFAWYIHDTQKSFQLFHDLKGDATEYVNKEVHECTVTRFKGISKKDERARRRCSTLRDPR